MKPLRGMHWLCALGLAAASAGPANAAWNNVFQVCCASCGGGPAVSNYAPDPCNPCPPPPTCTTRYVQRSYYTPVTTYQSRSYYEPVTSYRTSYYYEPVTTYRYSCYCDPCGGCCRQVACPETSYVLRSQCNPVTSYVQRCMQVPVTSYQQSYYYEPVTTCCQPPAPTCSPTAYSAPSPAPVASAAPPAIPSPAYSSPAPPRVSEQSSPASPPPGVSEFPSDKSYQDRYYPIPDNQPRISGSGYRQAPHAAPVTPPAPRPPTVRLERVVAGPVATLQGEVVSNDNAPRSGTRVLLVSATRKGAHQTVTTDSTGKFRVTLASGGWFVYVKGADNKPIFYSEIKVRDNETRQVTLVSR